MREGEKMRREREGEGEKTGRNEGGSERVKGVREGEKRWRERENRRKERGKEKASKVLRMKEEREERKGVEGRERKTKTNRGMVRRKKEGSEEENENMNGKKEARKRREKERKGRERGRSMGGVKGGGEEVGWEGTDPSWACAAGHKAAISTYEHLLVQLYYPARHLCPRRASVRSRGALPEPRGRCDVANAANTPPVPMAPPGVRSPREITPMNAKCATPGCK